MLEDCGFVMRGLEALTLSHLESDHSALDGLVDQLVSLTCVVRPFRLCEAFVWTTLDKVKALAVQVGRGAEEEAEEEKKQEKGEKASRGTSDGQGRISLG